MDTTTWWSLILSLAGVAATFVLGWKNIRLTNQNNIFQNAMALNTQYRQEITRLQADRDRCQAELERCRQQRLQALHEAATQKQRLDEERALFEKKLAQRGQERKE